MRSAIRLHLIDICPPPRFEQRPTLARRSSSDQTNRRDPDPKRDTLEGTAGLKLHKYHIL